MVSFSFPHSPLLWHTCKTARTSEHPRTQNPKHLFPCCFSFYSVVSFVFCFRTHHTRHCTCVRVFNIFFRRILSKSSRRSCSQQTTILLLPLHSHPRTHARKRFVSLQPLTPTTVSLARIQLNSSHGQVSERRVTEGVSEEVLSLTHAHTLTRTRTRTL